MKQKKDNRKRKNKIVADLWGREESTTKRYGRGFHWVESPVVIEYMNKNIAGNANLDWVTYIFQKYLQKTSGVLKLLSLGCGAGNLERHLFSLAPFRKIDAYDISEGAIKAAQLAANKANMQINYMTADLNEIKLPKIYYDVIFMDMSLHHVEELEHLLNEVNNALKVGGLFIINEFVGPSQFQYTKKQVEVINDIIDLLPSIYRSRVTDSKILKPFFAPPSIEYMNANDPSEAIRSAEIIESVKRIFEVLEQKDYGGTILHMLLQDIIGNFDPENERDKTVLQLILYIEKLLIREKIIESDFTLMVLRKKNYFWQRISSFKK